MACYFLTVLATQINHLMQFYRTANKMKQTIQEHNDNTYAVESSLLSTNLVHAFVIPNYAEPEALIRDTISRIAIHKYV
jgi:hypothetical protein